MAGVFKFPISREFVIFVKRSICKLSVEHGKTQAFWVENSSHSRGSRPGRRCESRWLLVLARRNSRDDRIGDYCLCAGVSFSHLRGRGLRDPHRIHGPDPDGQAQGLGMPDVPLPLPGERERSPRQRGGLERFPQHLPDVSLHSRRNPPECPEEAVSQLRWRPHPGCQVSLRIR